jgi:hypothetical protein
MRVRVIRWTDPTSSYALLAVQRWCDGQWEVVRNFPLNESEQAHAFAMSLSLTKRIPVEMAVFEDGQKLSDRSSCDPNDADHSYNSIRNNPAG